MRNPVGTHVLMRAGLVTGALASADELETPGSRTVGDSDFAPLTSLR